MGNLSGKEEFKGEILLKDFHPSYYEMESLLDKGGQGVVFKYALKESFANRKNIPAFIALKNVAVKSVTGEATREFKILKDCRHDNILRLFSWQLVTIQHDVDHLHLCTELCDFNLRTFMQKHELEISIVLHLSRQIIRGCQYLHSKQIVHRDIKPENILINYKGGTLKGTVVKLADFGFARLMPSSAVDSSFQYTACGTWAYASPEIIHAVNSKKLAEPKSSFATDIFSSGVVIFEMVSPTKSPPFSFLELGQETFDVEARVRQLKLLENIDTSQILRLDIHDFLINMLSWRPKDRPAAEDIMDYFMEDDDHQQYAVQNPINSIQGPFGSYNNQEREFAHNIQPSHGKTILTLLTIVIAFISMFGAIYSGVSLDGFGRNETKPGPNETDIFSAEDPLRIVNRQEWGAMPATKITKIDKQVSYQFVHHSAGQRCHTLDECSKMVRDIQEFHMKDKEHMWNDIGYSFLIGEDGNVYEGRGWNVVGAHTLGYNKLGYGTCFIGNFMDTVPAQAAVDAYMQLLKLGVAEGWVKPDYQLFSHRQASEDTLSPGDRLNELVQTWPHWVRLGDHVGDHI